jgi:hypothetical protein
MTSGRRSSKRSGGRSGVRSGPKRSSARRNVRKAARVAKQRRTIANLPKKTRSALAKQANKVKRQRRAAGRRTSHGTS